MFNNKYQPYQQVPHDDSDNEIELNDMNPMHPPTANQSTSSRMTQITDLLKLTAHRRIRNRSTSSSNSQTASIDINDNAHSVIHIDDDNDHQQHSESHTLINSQHVQQRSHDMLDDIDLNETHAADDEDEDDDDDDTLYDDHIFLLALDGKKRKVGVMHDWKVWQLKERYFRADMKEGHKVRLIYRGKLLQDAVELNTYSIGSNGFVHVSISKHGQIYKGSANGETASNSSQTNYDNFDDGMDDEAVARRLQMEMNDEMGSGVQGNDGFNRFGFGVSRMDEMNNEADLNRARREFFCGLFLGSVAGFWVLIFLILANRNQYSRRFRLGVTLGVAINLLINLSYQYPNGSNHENSNESTSDAEGNNDAQTSEENASQEGS